MLHNSFFKIEKRIYESLNKNDKVTQILLFFYKSFKNYIVKDFNQMVLVFKIGDIASIKRKNPTSMKINFVKTIFCFILIFATNKMVNAQLSFPNGNVLNLKTAKQNLYTETKISFNTGKFKANDYSWSKKLDSIDSRWLVTACFNGDCKNDLLQSGTFLKDFGLNDTTCFIAFHVESYEYTGTSKIIYYVFNKNNPLDSATLYFNISYTKPSGLNDLKENNLSIYPNPVNNKISIKSALDLQNAKMKIVNSLGEIMTNKELKSEYEFDVSNLKNGVYFLSIISNTHSFTHKFIKE